MTLGLIGGLVSCKEKEGSGSDTTINVTGIVIGSYSNGWRELLVQVDKKYQIGKTIEYIETCGNCTEFPHNGKYHNMIKVQSHLPLPNLPENETVINKRISFSYRLFNEEEDTDLFLFGHGNAMCIPPDVPLYVITECQIIKLKEL
ncbi:MAG: hypothetical protein LBV47_01385 [Bacteroidales bacterium]|nr:hypothetical protein [Bacteroidales bacterium]